MRGCFFTLKIIATFLVLNATGHLIGFWLDGIVFGRNDARRTFNYHKVKDAQYVISSLQNMKSNESR